MKIFNIFILIIYITWLKATRGVSENKEIFLHKTPDQTKIKHLDSFELKLMDLMGCADPPQNRPKRQTSLKNSASKFLLEIYNDITPNDHELEHVRKYLTQGRQKRALKEENFITKVDMENIAKCTDILTISSYKHLRSRTDLPILSDMPISFNTNDVPHDLQLGYSALRIYQEPSSGKYQQNTDTQTATISIYQRVENQNQYSTGNLRLLSSINTTTSHKGWLDFNMTHIINEWLQQTFRQPGHLKELLVGVTLYVGNSTNESIEILAGDLGLVNINVAEDMADLQPFIIGYFNCHHEDMDNSEKLHIKRNSYVKRKRYADNFISSNLNIEPSIEEVEESSKTCQRLNLTINFEDFDYNNFVVAPREFDAYYCDGECSFPPDAKIYATNHAILQSAIHSKQPSFPQPRCVPSALTSLNILYFRNNDTVHLKTLPDIVVEECGCF